MTWLLDTNACVRFLNSDSSSLMARILAAEPPELAVCSVVRAELAYGALRSRDPARVLDAQRRFLSKLRSYPFDDSSADAYAEIRAQLTAAGTPIGPNDLMIAAIAVANGLTLVTHNVREFARVPHLSWEDWERPNE